MNNNIGNMNGASPMGFNPQGHKAPSQPDKSGEAKEVQNDTVQNGDLLKFVPEDQYGRSMVNRAQGQRTMSSINRQTVEDDIFTFQLMNDFVEDLTKGYVQKGVSPERAREMAALTADVLLNSQVD